MQVSLDIENAHTEHLILTHNMENLPEDYFVKINQFVKTTHR